MFKFKKQERLCSKKSIEKLYKEGKTILLYPLKITYLITNEQDFSFPAKVLFVVPKKKFKKAVQRNRIKRLLRENYRLSKNVFYQVLKSKEKNILISISYIANEEKKFDEINDATKLALHKILDNII